MLQKILKKFSMFFRRKDQSGLSVFGHGQSVDWELLLALFLLVVCATVSMSAYVFFEIKSGSIFTVEKQQVEAVHTIDRDNLQTVITTFSSKATTLSNLQDNRPVFIDPSR